MNLIWKLLRRHISIGQFAGFFFANLLGMLIMLSAVQFCSDLLPMFSRNDSFLKNDYLIISKHVGTVSSLSGRSNTFDEEEIRELRRQDFCKSVGAFAACRYQVDASVSMAGSRLRTELFFESVPDDFIDIQSDAWHFSPGDTTIPIILPRNYLALYNFGFAQSRSLPKLSESIIGMVRLDIRLRGNGKEGIMTGRVVGFSNRLNTILVPESFIIWSNALYAPHADLAPTRLIVEVFNPADASIAKYLEDNGYETEGDKSDAGKTTYFLQIVSAIVVCVGLLISLLSFYILMLSVYLLVEKNTTKLENLLLIGYSPMRVSLPYQMLTVGMNALVLVLAGGLLLWFRHYYIEMLRLVFPEIGDGSLWPSATVGVILFIVVSLLNIIAVRRKIMAIWKHKN